MTWTHTELMGISNANLGVYAHVILVNKTSKDLRNSTKIYWQFALDNQSDKGPSGAKTPFSSK